MDPINIFPENVHKGAWALCNRTVTDLRREPLPLAERVSQVLLGEVLSLLEEKEDWYRVRMERDGYNGWIHSAALYPCTSRYAHQYSMECQVKVLAEILPARSEASLSAGEETGKIPFGIQLPIAQEQGRFSQVRLPDGRLWWVESKGLLPIELWPKPSRAGVAFTIELVKRFIGVPYLWGGRTPFGFDCSGFTAAFWEFLGITLPRDADQQYHQGEAVAGQYQPGDLLFFHNQAGGTPEADQNEQSARITHVALSLGENDLIHANGAAWGVSYNSIDPESKRFRPWLKNHLYGARRYL